MRNVFYQLFIIIAWLPAVVVGVTPPGLTGDRERDIEIASDWLQDQAPPDGGQEVPSGEVLPPPPVVRVGGDGACQFNSIQAAIDASSGPVEIRIARNASYTNQSLSVLNRSVTLKGGYADCGSQVQTSPNTAIGGTSHFGLLHIVNNDDDVRRVVNIDRLTLENGDNTSTFGGAVRIVGRLLVMMRDTTVRNSTALNGGGIWIFGSTAGDTELLLRSGTIISGNAAIGLATSSGGGIWCTRAAVELAHPSVSVLFNNSFGTNTAGAGGGGIYLNDCSLVSRAGQGFLTGITGNFSAARGGGIHAVGSTLTFRHFPGTTTGPQVASNGSEHEGGGISLHQSTMSAQELAVFGNTALGPGLAGVGGGIAAQENSAFIWGRNLFTDSNCPAADQGCNRLSGNQASFAGGGLSLQSGSFGLIRQIEISGNQGGINSAVSVAGDNTGLNLEGALITGNTSTGTDSTQNSVVRLRGGASLRLAHATIADNPGHGRIIDIADTGNELFLYSSVISEASGGAIFSSFGADATTRCLMTHHVLFDFDHASNTVRSHSHRAQLFKDPDAGDYRPNPFGSDQLLIDYCSGDGGLTTTPADGLLTERGIDLPEVPNRDGQLSGPYDIGAYELCELPDDTIFSDRFELPDPG